MIDNFNDITNELEKLKERMKVLEEEIKELKII